MSEQLVLIEKANGVATLTLNRPDAMNALSRGLRAAISDAVDALEADPDVRVLILTGAGRAFCAGLDLKELGGDTSGLGANAAILNHVNSPKPADRRGGGEKRSPPPPPPGRAVALAGGGGALCTAARCAPPT